VLHYLRLRFSKREQTFVYISYFPDHHMIIDLSGCLKKYIHTQNKKGIKKCK